MRTALAVLVLFACVPGGCVRVQFHSTGSGASVPEAMLGDWGGTWTSSDGSQRGTAQIRLQSFQGRPLVRFTVDNPCLLPQPYRFVIADRHLELQGTAEVLFEGDLDADLHSLAGTYQCPEDHGTWSLAWQQPVEAVGDLSGHWTGTLRTTLAPEVLSLALDLQQTWIDGQLRVAGEIQVEDGVLTATITSGAVDWDAGRFAVQLMVEQPATMLLEGIGDARQMRLQDGVLIAQRSGAPPLPIGTFSLAKAE